MWQYRQLQYITLITEMVSCSDFGFLVQHVAFVLRLSAGSRHISWHAKLQKRLRNCTYTVHDERQQMIM